MRISTKSTIVFLAVLLGCQVSFADDKPVYKDDWRQCKQNSDCLAVREGFNWTCINKDSEKDARTFCKSVDSFGDLTDFQKQFCQEYFNQASLPQPVCSEGVCYCLKPEEDEGVVIVKESCQQDSDCTILKVGHGWGTLNNEHAKRFAPYLGAVCSNLYEYPAPKAVCSEGQCVIKKIHQDKPTFVKPETAGGSLDHDQKTDKK